MPPIRKALTRFSPWLAIVAVYLVLGLAGRTLLWARFGLEADVGTARLPHVLTGSFINDLVEAVKEQHQGLVGGDQGGEKINGQNGRLSVQVLIGERRQCVISNRLPYWEALGVSAEREKHGNGQWLGQYEGIGVSRSTALYSIGQEKRQA